MKISKLLVTFLFFLLSICGNSMAATPKKIGPVSYYGALHTSGNKIIGAKNNQQAMLRGMSLFWSDGTGQSYYRNTVISWAADNLHIDVFRFAMGIEYYNSQGQATEPLIASDSYKGNPNGLINLLDKMVNAAIENDIYIIVDWHSHRAENEQSLAVDFFGRMAKKYADVPNIIWEVYNEPVYTGTNAIANYAKAVIKAIRDNGSNNLALVGTPSWSQMGNGSCGTVSGDNIGYVFHFYAGTHKLDRFKSNIENCGSPVFITEWGTTNSDGDGAPDTYATNDWTSYMDQKQIPNCNWSPRQYTSHTDGKKEQSAFFEGSTALTTSKALDEASLTTSGKIVKSYLTSHSRSWADSLTKGKRSGNCAASHIIAKETDGTVTGKLKSGCTYTSSDESVATVSGTTLTIKGYGFSILTANDGTQTAVIVQAIPNQTINGFMEVTCAYTGSCSSGKGSSQTLDFDDDGNKEWVFPPSGTTDQGATYTLKSLDPTVINVKKATCSASACSGSQRGKSIWMYQFNDFGSARIVATAPAVTGFRAMNDTVTITYTKGENRILGFKSRKMEPGETIQGALPDTSVYGYKITYTFDGESSSPYLTKVGTDAVAGSQKAIVMVTATIPETDILAAVNKTVTFTIGDTVAPVVVPTEDDPATPPAALATTAAKPVLGARVAAGKQLQLSSGTPGVATVRIYDLKGNMVLQKEFNGSKTINLNHLPKGSYVIQVRQASQQQIIRWNSL